MKVKRKIDRAFSILLSLALILALVPMTATTASAAGYGKVEKLPTGAGSTLTSNIYKVEANTTISAGSNGNGLSVAGGETAVIYIPKGVTLTVRGGHGSAQNAGAAGINLPSNSTLIITGGGSLNVYGGNSGYSSSGSSGSSGYWNGGSGSSMCSGAGGSGGYGAGGAGAAIGGNGGYGGSGGSGGSTVYGERSNGDRGGDGSYGNSGTSGGTVYIFGTVLVNTYGGSSAGGASGGYYGGGSSNKLGRYAHVANGGGGGGGGGSTYSAPGIGGGTGGAGGGGGGGSGANTRGNDSNKSRALYNTGAGGGGGSGGSSGYAGSRDYGSWWGGGGGGGGGRGGSGGSGYVYKAPTATLNGNGSNGAATGHTSVNYAATFDQEAGSGGTTGFTATYGVVPTNITIPVKAQHEFLGYYTQADGKGTRYFDHRGLGVAPWEETKDTTLYALWKQSQFNITFNKQGGGNGTDFIVTSSNDGTLIPITPPSREHYVFEGYFDKASGGGEQYYDSTGAVVGNKKLTASTTLFAKWRQNEFEMRLDKLGGTGGNGNTYTLPEGVLPKLEMPTMAGYALRGYTAERFYHSDADLYYGPDGTPVAGKTIKTMTTLFAQWYTQTYKISYLGLEGATISGNPATRTYLADCKIPQPTKTGYTFLGWQVDDAQARVVDLTIPATTAIYAKDLTLTATWTKGASTDVKVGAEISGAVSNPDEIKNQLSEVFKTVVPDTGDNTGITAKDLDAESINILLKVDKDTNPTNQDLINNISQNSKSEFYDITAEKTVTTTAGVQLPVVLKEIPSHLDVKIPLKGDMADLASYVVYRVHEGKPERLSADSTSGAEYYTVETLNGTPNIVIHTRKFSTYAIAGSVKTTNPDGEEMANGNAQDVGGFDVQGRIIEKDHDLVYKVDISWGAMKYDFATNKEWDPVTHTYSEGGFNGWKPEAFDGRNNKLSAINHSNAGVIVNYALVENNLTGVDMTLRLYNNSQSEPAHSMQLPAAPLGSVNSDLTPFDAYMFLTGAPENKWLTTVENQTFQKVGRIVVTVFPQQP